MELKIQNIVKYYGKKIALRGVYIALTPGIYGLLGPNGAGKTTLMNILVNLFEPSEGIVMYNNRNISNMGAKYRELLGYLPQQVGMYKNFTGYDMLMYFAALKGMSKAQAKPVVEDMLKAVNLSSDKNRRIGHYSGGMKQRLGIAQALLGDPKILIFDEPTAGLDPKERIRFMNIISELAKDKIIILATHIVSDVEQIADQLLFLKKGQLIVRGTPEKCLEIAGDTVWSAIVDHSTYDSIIKQSSVSKVENIEGQLKIRIISKTKPVEQAKLVTPTLEDVYMCLFGEVDNEVIS